MQMMSLNLAQTSPCSLASTHGNQGKHSHKLGQYEDIPGMLLFDSDLLCVDGLIDADSLGRGGKEEMENRGKKKEKKNQATASVLCT